MKIYDISVSISSALPVYDGDPPIGVTRVNSLEAGDAYGVSRLDLSTHIGTHVDPPAHFIRGGQTVDQLSLEAMIGPCRVLDARGLARIDAAWLEGQPLEGVTRLLFKTDNSGFWRELNPAFHRDYVALEADGARLLVARGIGLVGIDYLSIEKFGFDQPETHLALLGNGVIVVEGLDLGEVPPGDYELICLPIKIEEGDGAPARVVLRK